MIEGLINHLWQSTWFAALVWILILPLRKNRASIRYWLWFGASFKFFVPFALLITLGSHLALTRPAQKIAVHIPTPAVSPTMAQITQPFRGAARPMPSKESARDWLSVFLFAIWASGSFGITLMRFREWLRIRAALRSSVISGIAASVPVRSSSGLLEPGVVGLWRQILLLPTGIEERLTPPQLQAVLAHEVCHVRRRDNLFASIHMIAEAAFWFHPVVWWIGARLMEERERACDEEVLRLGSEPRIYAEGIVNVCKLYTESPLVCISGVTGSNLKKRIEVIMANHVVLKLNLARKLALGIAGIAVLTLPVVIGIMNTPIIRAQFANAVPRFKEVSIRYCGDAPGLDGPVAAPGGATASASAPPPPPPPPPRKMGHGRSSSPGVLNTGCMPLAESFGLIQQAYVRFADGNSAGFWPAMIPIEGGPAWIHSELYEINAKADGNPSEEFMRGPMMQALLEDRFKLTIHRETRNVPMYALTLAPGGLRLALFQEGSCLPVPPKATLPAPPSGQRYCKVMVSSRPPAVHAEGATLTEFSQLLTLVLVRPVVDKTGILGKFDINLQFAIDAMTPRFLPGGDMARFSQANLADPTILSAIQKLGLKLEPTNGPRESIVIDSMERPSAMR